MALQEAALRAQQIRRMFDEGFWMPFVAESQQVLAYLRQQLLQAMAQAPNQDRLDELVNRVYSDWVSLTWTPLSQRFENKERFWDREYETYRKTFPEDPAVTHALNNGLEDIKDLVYRKHTSMEKQARARDLQPVDPVPLQCYVVVYVLNPVNQNTSKTVTVNLQAVQYGPAAPAGQFGGAAPAYSGQYGGAVAPGGQYGGVAPGGQYGGAVAPGGQYGGVAPGGQYGGVAPGGQYGGAPGGY